MAQEAVVLRMLLYSQIIKKMLGGGVGVGVGGIGGRDPQVNGIIERRYLIATREKERK